MSISIQVKSIFANVFEYCGATQYVFDRYSSCKCLILMYHRIIPYNEAESRLQAGMYVEPKTFEMHIRYLKKYFNLIPMSEITKQGHARFLNPKGLPVCVLTFDDGWYDFYKYAYPILSKHDVPATVFLTTNFIGTKNRFWTDTLARLCYGREREDGEQQRRAMPTNSVMRLLENGDGSVEKRLERAIETMKALPMEEITNTIASLSDRWRIDTTPYRRDFLTWDETREMHRSGLVSFGSHTETHRILTTLRDDEIEEELGNSKNRLATEGVVDPSFIPFAYPNGNFNDNIINLVRKNNYSLAVTTRKGWVRFSDGCGSFALNRIGIHQDMASTPSMLGCRILQFI